MKKTILAALIAATALAPFSAVAQEWQGRRGGRGGGDRAEGQPTARPDAGSNREAFRNRADSGRSFDREAFRAQRRAARADQPIGAVAPPRPGTGDQPGLRPEGGAFRQQRRADDAAQRTPRPERFGNRQDARPGDVERGRFPDWNRGDDRYRPDRGQERRGTWNRGPDGNRGDDRYRPDRGQQGRGTWNRQPDWNRGNDRNRPDWNRNAPGRGDWNRGGDRWNRDWRSDRRYNWQDWRGRNRSIYRLPRYYAPRGYHYGYQRFGIGVTLGSILFAQNYWINDPWQYRLPPAYGPYRWVRYYNDALLVDLNSGQVVDVIYDIFW